MIYTWWWQSLGAVLAVGFIVTLVWCIWDAGREVIVCDANYVQHRKKRRLTAFHTAAYMAKLLQNVKNRINKWN